MTEITGSPTATLDEGGYIVAITDAATPAFRRLSVAEVNIGVTKAQTALQPEAVGGAAYEDEDAYVRTDSHAADIATMTALIEAQAATIATLQAQVTALENTVGNVSGNRWVDTDVWDDNAIWSDA